MTLIGFSTLIRMEEGYTRCPDFWDVEYNRKYARMWQTGQTETPVEQALLENRIGRFAICEQKADCFEYWIAGLYRGGALEVYSAGDMQSPDYECGIWVPIVRPQQTADDSAETAVAAALLGLL